MLTGPPEYLHQADRFHPLHQGFITSSPRLYTGYHDWISTSRIGLLHQCRGRIHRRLSGQIGVEQSIFQHLSNKTVLTFRRDPRPIDRECSRQFPSYHSHGSEEENLPILRGLFQRAILFLPSSRFPILSCLFRNRRAVGPTLLCRRLNLAKFRGEVIELRDGVRSRL